MSLSVPISELPVVPAWGGGCLCCRAVAVYDAVSGPISVSQCSQALRVSSGVCLSVSASLAIHHNSSAWMGSSGVAGGDAQ